MTETRTLTSLVAEGDIKPNQRRSLSAETADKLRELILLEKLPPGMHIPERDLAEALGISRTPMREALRILEAEGLVDHTPTRRSRVANPSVEELSQSMQVLGMLEALGGELAAAHATDSQLEAISALNKRMHAASGDGSPVEFFKMDMDFHTSIIASSGNAPLVETHSKYNAQLWRARFLSSRNMVGRATTLQQHQDITDALLAREPATAAAAMRRHIDTAIDNVAIARDAQETSE